MRLTGLSLLAMLLISACGSITSNQPPTATSAIDPNVPTPAPGEFNPNPFATPVEGGDGDGSGGVGRITGDSPDNPGVSLTLEAFGAPVIASPDPNTTPFAFAGGAGNVSEPGVIVREATREPYTGDVVFDRVTVIRAGGPTDNERQIEILADGNVIINGNLARNIGPQGLAEVNALLQELDVFSLQGTFAAAATAPDDFVYVLSVVRGGESVSIRADDALIPDELAFTINQLFFIAEGSASAPPPRISPTPTVGS